MLYNSISILVLDIICYLLLYIVAIPTAIFLVINILVSVCKIRNKKNDNKIFVVSIIVSIILSIILSNYVNIIFRYNTTSINNKKYSDLKSIICEVIDFKEKKTEIIYVEMEDLQIYNEHKYIKGSNSEKYNKEIYYYLNIRNSEYIIPISNVVDYNKIHDLLYNKEFGNRNIKIEVYKNTKFIKSINGIDI